MSADAVDTLLRLAHDFSARGCHAQAAKCLQPACDAAAAPPAARMAARLALAALLLDHAAGGADEARRLLQRAEVEARAARGVELLRCEVLEALGRCSARLGRPADAAEAYAAGAELCERGGAAKRDAAALERWRAFFRFRLAEARLAGGAPAEALAELGRAAGGGGGGGGAPPADAALVALGRTLAHLHAGAADAAQEALAAAAPLVEAARGGGGDAGLAAALHVQYLLTYVAAAVAGGRVMELARDGEFPYLEDLSRLLAERGGAAWAHPWAPPAALQAAVLLLLAALHRSVGKPGRAVVPLAQLGELVEARLRAHGADLAAAGPGGDGDGGSEAAAQLLPEARAFVGLKLMLLEELAAAALVQGDFAAAAAHVAAAADAVDRHPGLLAAHAPATRLAAAQYLHGVGELAAAQSLFQAVADMGPPHLRRPATLCAALAELQRDGGSAEAAAEIAAAAAAGERAAPSGERAGLQLVQGMLALRRGDATGARMLLSRALRHAHGVLGNTQLVAQILNVLAPVQDSKQDASGARQMLESAATLLKAAGDVPSLVTTLRELCRMHAGDDDVAGKSAAYLGRKAGEVAARVAAAAAGDDHARVVAWARAQVA